MTRSIRTGEVLRLLGDGLETPEIATRLGGIAEETARNHIRVLLPALGAHSRLEAVLMGLRAGVISADSTPRVTTTARTCSSVVRIGTR
jgi:DNA-binding NarL/FixJ family response regulator